MGFSLDYILVEHELIAFLFQVKFKARLLDRQWDVGQELKTIKECLKKS